MKGYIRQNIHGRVQQRRLINLYKLQKIFLLLTLLHSNTQAQPFRRTNVRNLPVPRLLASKGNHVHSLEILSSIRTRFIEISPWSISSASKKVTLKSLHNTRNVILETLFGLAAAKQVQNSVTVANFQQLLHGVKKIKQTNREIYHDVVYYDPVVKNVDAFVPRGEEYITYEGAPGLMFDGKLSARGVWLNCRAEVPKKCSLHSRDFRYAITRVQEQLGNLAGQ